MRYFLTRATPRVWRVLLVESGSRSLVERIIATLHRAYGPDLPVDVVTCYAGPPAGLPAESAVFRVGDYGGPQGRMRLLADLRDRKHTIVAVVCSAEPIMTKWKWWLAWKLPCKVLIVNENCDWFFLDRAHLRLAAHFVLFRSGLSGDDAPATLFRIVAFPFALAYLLAFAAAVHLRRIFSR